MGTTEVVEVLPFLELFVEEAGVVDNDALEEPVELLLVDPVGSLDFPVRDAVWPGGCRSGRCRGREGANGRIPGTPHHCQSG